MPVKRKSFKLKYIIDIYSLARDGANDKVIARHLNVTPACFSQWKKKHKSVIYALQKAEEHKSSVTDVDWTSYINNRIPDELKPIWRELTRFESDTSGYDKARQLIEGESKKIRQQLVVYSVLSSNFNLTKALKRVGVSRSMFNRWAENDPDFVALLNEVQEIKGDFFEEGLMKLVQQGDSPATIFGNRTFNRKRGYGEHISTTTDVNVTVAALPLHELDLPSSVLRQILDAMKKKNKAIPVASTVIEHSAKQLEGVRK
jgi:hypothetical protein